MSDNQINCIGCDKPLKSNSILKHLSHKDSCKTKYSDSEINNLIAKSKEAYKINKKSWKKKDYENNKEKYAKSNAIYRKKASIKSYGEELQEKFDFFHKRRMELIENVSDSNSKSKSQMKSIEERAKSKFDELMEHVRFALKNFETCNESELLQKIRSEWSELMKEMNEMIDKFTPRPSKGEQFRCSSCDKSLEKNGILPHLSKMPSCKDSYEKSGELEVLKSNAKKRKKERDHQYYLNEREIRAQNYQESKKEYEAFKKFEFFEKKKEDFAESYEGYLNRAKRLFVLWKGEDWKGMEGERCRKEIERLRKIGNAEVMEDMSQIENMISDKIEELENCLEEVATEVKEITGNWEFDEAEKWQKIWLEDCRVKAAMFECVKHHIEEEIECLYVTAIQHLKDSAAKIGQEIEPHKKDHELYKPKRWKRSYYLNDHYLVPRNVILK